MARLRDALGELGIGGQRARLHDLHGDHRAAASHVADGGNARRHVGEARDEEVTDRPCTPVEVIDLHGLDRAQRCRAGDGVASVGATQASDMNGIHDVGAPGDGGERQSRRDALGGSDQVRDDALVLAGEPRAGATEAGLDLVGDEDDAVLRGVVAQCLEEAGRGDDEPALTLDGLDQDGRDAAATDLLLHFRDRPGGHLEAAVRAVVEGVGHWHAVDLGRERTEVVLVGHRLGREGHREIGAAVVSVVEDHHGLALGVGARDLDGVLDRLGSGVEQG